MCFFSVLDLYSYSRLLANHGEINFDENCYVRGDAQRKTMAEIAFHCQGLLTTNFSGLEHNGNLKQQSILIRNYNEGKKRSQWRFDTVWSNKVHGIEIMIGPKEHVWFRLASEACRCVKKEQSHWQWKNNYDGYKKAIASPWSSAHAYALFTAV